MPQVSVIIPTRNRALMLRGAIESAKAAGTNVEVIVVDDASTDETQFTFGGSPEITYLRMRHNVGQAEARNQGIKVSTAEFIAFLDDDDLRLPGSLDLQLELFARHDSLGFVYGPVLIGDPVSRAPTGEVRCVDSPTGDVFWDLIRRNFIYIPSVVVRRELIEAIGLFQTDVLGTEDWDAWLKLAAISKVGAVRDPVAIYRDFSRESGQTSSYRPGMWRASARTQARALRSTRAMSAPNKTRRSIRTEFMDNAWYALVSEGHGSLKNNLRYAFLNYMTGILLCPRRAVQAAFLKIFMVLFRS